LNIWTRRIRESTGICGWMQERNWICRIRQSRWSGSVLNISFTWQEPNTSYLMEDSHSILSSGKAMSFWRRGTERRWKNSYLIWKMWRRHRRFTKSSSISRHGHGIISSHRTGFPRTFSDMHSCTTEKCLRRDIREMTSCIVKIRKNGCVRSRKNCICRRIKKSSCMRRHGVTTNFTGMPNTNLRCS